MCQADENTIMLWSFGGTFCFLSFVLSPSLAYKARLLLVAWAFFFFLMRTTQQSRCFLSTSYIRSISFFSQEMEIEATDDIMRQSGSGGGESYFGTPLPRLVASRVGWLVSDQHHE